MTYRLAYLCKARRTTSDRLSPRSSALACAADHRSSGMRNVRIGVLGALGMYYLHGGAQPRPATIGKGHDGVEVIGETRDGADKAVTVKGRVDRLHADPLVGVGRALGGDLVLAYAGPSGLHVIPLSGRCVDTVSRCVDTLSRRLAE